MLHSLAARILLMVMDFGIDFDDACRWVCRRLPSNLQAYYHKQVSMEILAL